MPTETSNLLVDFQLVPPSPDKPAETDEEDRHECNFATQEETTTPVTFFAPTVLPGAHRGKAELSLQTTKKAGLISCAEVCIKQVLQDKFWTLHTGPTTSWKGKNEEREAKR